MPYDSSLRNDHRVFDIIYLMQLVRPSEAEAAGIIHIISHLNPSALSIFPFRVLSTNSAFYIQDRDLKTYLSQNY
jgi:hypothetical protein